MSRSRKRTKAPVVEADLAAARREDVDTSWRQRVEIADSHLAARSAQRVSAGLSRTLFA
jgi:hypothetical protein